jgi:hypothetical protein
MKYYILKYSDDLPDGFGGATQGPFIKVRPRYQNDGGLLEHEKTHVQQWYALMGLGLAIVAALALLVSPALCPAAAVAPFLHPLLYKFLRPYRQWCEVQAYREQIEADGNSNSDFAVTALVEKYHFRLSIDEARALLND